MPQMSKQRTAHYYRWHTRRFLKNWWPVLVALLATSVLYIAFRFLANDASVVADRRFIPLWLGLATSNVQLVGRLQPTDPAKIPMDKLTALRIAASRFMALVALGLELYWLAGTVLGLSTWVSLQFLAMTTPLLILCVIAAGVWYHRDTTRHPDRRAF